MTTFTHRIEHDPGQVFATLTDLVALPRRNRALTQVLETPDSLDPAVNGSWR